MNLLYFLLAKIFYSFGYFHGSSRIQSKISRSLPLTLGRVMHPLGFSWMLSSRDALSTYLSSCEAFSTRLVLFQAVNIDSFICVGANLGWYPLLVGARNKKVRIVAFECNSSIYDELSQNVTENDNQSELYRFAIGDHVSMADLYMPKDGNAGMSTLFPLGKQSHGASTKHPREPQWMHDSTIVERVDVTTLDVCLSDSLATIGRTLILMDIEGSEMMALKGASRLLRGCSPTLILEINPELLVAADTSASELLQYLRKYDYEVYWIDEREHLVRVGNDNQLPHLSILPPHSGANYLFVKNDENWVNKFIKV